MNQRAKDICVMRIEAKHTTGGSAADEWGSEPNLRAEIKMKIAEEIARKLRTNDAINWSWRINDAGDFEVTGSIDLHAAASETPCVEAVDP